MRTTRRGSKVIAEHGWPGHALVGVDGAHAAWLLAQHAPPEFQSRWLDLLRAAVEGQDAQPRGLAYLQDGVNLHQNEPQDYGTQWISLGDNDTPRLFPLADREKVNSWRAAIDLAPIDQHDLDSAWQPDELHRFESTGTTPGEGGDTR